MKQRLRYIPRFETLESRYNPSVEFPLDAGVINVTLAPYNAIPNDGLDDTAAIQAAINANVNRRRVLYFPDGVYNLTDSLRSWNGDPFPDGRNITYQGQSRAGTIFRLNNNNPLFDGSVAANVRPVLDLYNGNTANAFGVYVQDLTVDVGVGNPGAIGIEYQTSNYGSMRNVSILSSDPAGAGRTGLNVAFNFPGPMLIKNVSIDGFQTGIAGAPQEYSATFENITLRNQTQQAINVWRLPLQFRNLTVEGSVPALRSLNNPGAWGHVVIDQGTFTYTGPAPGTVDAVENEPGSGLLMLRNITTSGYARSIDDQFVGQTRPDGFIAQYSTDAPLSVFPTAPTTIGLPFEDVTPTIDPLSNWVSITSFGAIPNDVLDDTAAIQAAMDSGFSTIYFPNGRYNVTKTITVGGNVSRIAGIQSTLNMESGVWMETAGVFRFVPGQRDTVMIDNLNFEGTGFAHAIQHDSLATLIIRDTSLDGYRNGVRGGKVFLENNVGNDMIFTGQKVWARQLNPEGKGTKVINDGGDFIVWGIKTEGDGTVVETRNRGRSEVLGGLVYPAEDITPGTPMFINNESSLVFSIPESSYTANSFYNIWVRETRNGVTNELLRSSVTRGHSNNGRALALYTGYITDATAPSNPTSFTATPINTSQINLSWTASTDTDTGIQQYRIFRGSTLIGSTTGTTWNDTGLADATQFNYTVLAVNGAGLSSGTAAASATTLTDTIKPVLLRAETPITLNRLTLTFSEPLAIPSATNPANYSIDNGVTVSAATLSADGRTVTLTTSALSAGVQYTVAVTGVTDRATTANPVVPGLAKAFTWNPVNIGTGLSATYFNNIDLTGTTVNRIDPTINFNWGNGSPDPAIDPDSFSARWTGSVQPTTTGRYTFYPRTDDGVRLWVNGVLLVDSWVNQAPTEVPGHLDVVAGQRYNIVMEYFENSGGASAELRWEGPGVAKQIIPATQLYTAASPVPTVVTVRTSAGTGADTQVSRLDPTTDYGNIADWRIANPDNTSGADTAGYVRFDLNSVNLSGFNIDAVNLLLTLRGGFGTGGGVRVAKVFGLNDSAPNQNWIETGPGFINWQTAPGNLNVSAHGDPLLSTWMGGIVVDNTGFALNNRTDALQLNTPALKNFVLSDTDRLLTFFFKRSNPSNEQTLFFSKEGSAPQAPALRLILVPQVSATPSAPSLLPGFDTGLSNSDRITSRNNSVPGQALRFNVPGTTPGATVTLYADGVAIGSAQATSSTTEVLTDGLLALSDGLRNITARQTIPGSGESVDSAVTSVTIDTTLPTVFSTQVNDGNAQRSMVRQLVVTFSEVMQLNLAAFSLVRTTGSGGTVTLGMTTEVVNNRTVATFTFSGTLTTVGSLVDGRYELRYDRSLVSDVAGNLAGSGIVTTMSLHRLFGDGNGDATVNAVDLTLFRATLGTTSGNAAYRNYFDANNDGQINSLDFTVFRANLGRTI